MVRAFGSGRSLRGGSRRTQGLRRSQKPCANRLRFVLDHGIQRKAESEALVGEMPSSPPNSALATFQSHSRAADQPWFHGHIPDQRLRFGPPIDVAHETILSLVTELIPCFDTNEFLLV